MSSETIQPAGFWIRLVAFILDSFILGLVSNIFSLILSLITILFTSEGSVIRIVILVLFYTLYSFICFMYFAKFYEKMGATPGKMLLGLKVVDVETGAYLGFGKTFLREILGKFISAIVFMLGFIIVGFRKDKRGLHDLIAGTQVIRSK
jgi:uncharacterized RDD family membrane protein YckC